MEISSKKEMEKKYIELTIIKDQHEETIESLKKVKKNLTVQQR